jgi:hypothetical protein
VSALADAIVYAAEVAAGHDGRAEVVLALRHQNGAESRLRLEADEAFRVLEASGAASFADLVGQPFGALADALRAPRG